MELKDLKVGNTIFNMQSLEDEEITSVKFMHNTRILNLKSQSLETAHMKVITKTPEGKRNTWILA